MYTCVFSQIYVRERQIYVERTNRKFDDQPNLRRNAPPNKLVAAHISIKKNTCGGWATRFREYVHNSAHWCISHTLLYTLLQPYTVIWLVGFSVTLFYHLIDAKMVGKLFHK